MPMSNSVNTAWSSKAGATALILGGLLTPVAIGLSLQLFPLGAPMLLYAGLAAVFGYLRPSQSWEWGLWTSGGILLALALALVLGSLASLFSSDFVGIGASWDMIRVTLLFGFLPALFGGCLGGVTGILIAHDQYRNAAVVTAVVVAFAVVASLLG